MVTAPGDTTLRYINAGHNPPLLFRGDTDEVIPLKAKGIALGVKHGVSLEEAAAEMKPGDTVVLYTDGITEAINEKGEAFGEGRLAQAVRSNRSLTAEELIHKIQDEVIAFAGTQPQYDDITLLIVKVNGETRKDRI
jgi:sigma-B regulation protein RsbU (phosphoserine phosphatase)